MQAGGFDLGALLQSAQAVQADMARAQASLGEQRVTGTAGGGLVSAEVDGHGQLQGLTIDRSVVDPDDVETLADLVVAAVRNAVREADALARRAMGSVAGGLIGGMGLPSLPGMPDLSGLAGTAGVVDAPDDTEQPAGPDAAARGGEG